MFIIVTILAFEMRYLTGMKTYFGRNHSTLLYSACFHLLRHSYQFLLAGLQDVPIYEFRWLMEEVLIVHSLAMNSIDIELKLRNEFNIVV